MGPKTAVLALSPSVIWLLGFYILSLPICFINKQLPYIVIPKQWQETFWPTISWDVWWHIFWSNLFSRAEYCWHIRESRWISWPTYWRSATCWLSVTSSATSASLDPDSFSRSSGCTISTSHDWDYVSSHNYRYLTSHYPTAAVFVCIAVVQKVYVDTSVSALKLC